MSKPCLGMSPIKDSETKVELECGENAEREQCPVYSYCHRGDTFSKCCPFPKNDGKINYNKSHGRCYVIRHYIVNKINYHISVLLLIFVFI